MSGGQPIRLATRTVDRLAEHRLVQAGTPPLIARLQAARGVRTPEDCDHRLARLLPPEGMKGLDAACEILSDAIDAGAPIVVVGDYDCDGATALATAVLGLRALGAVVDWLVPNRFENGYGLTPEVAREAAVHPRLGTPDVLMTVDNGIAAHAGVAEAQALGMTVIVTDHHLPGDTVPEAEAIVNPNQHGCPFPEKSMAGVGVMFYVLMALRSLRRSQGAWTTGTEPQLAPLLDLVALGTVADVVRLEHNNRILVAEGLRRIRAGRARPGIAALLQVAGREARRMSTQDLGFILGPRLNAAGRLSDMGLGVACLLAEDPAEALERATDLDRLNQERRTVEQAMRAEAEVQADHLLARASSTPGSQDRTDLSGVTGPDQPVIVLHDPNWHQGVSGLVASRIRERHHRPCIAFAPADTDGMILRGSGRSIPGVHLRDVLDLVDRRHPGLIERFGGHAMAAGLTLAHAHLEPFRRACAEAVTTLADPECWVPELRTDGPLSAAECTLENVDLIESAVWGQGFPSPVFAGRFRVLWQRVVGERHLKLSLVADDPAAGSISARDVRFGEAGRPTDLNAPGARAVGRGASGVALRGTKRGAAAGAAATGAFGPPRTSGPRFEAIRFNDTTPLPEQALIAYRIERNEWRGQASVSLVVEAVVDPAEILPNPAAGTDGPQ